MPVVDSETSELTVELIMIDQVQRIFAHPTDEGKKASDTESTTVAPASSLPASWLTPIELAQIEAFPTRLIDWANPVNEARKFASQSSYYEPWRDSIDGVIIGPFLVTGKIRDGAINTARACKSLFPSADCQTSASGWIEEPSSSFETTSESLFFGEVMMAAKSGFKSMFGTTEQGFLGWGPSLTHKHDILCIIIGALTPFLLRPVDNDGLDDISAAQKYSAQKYQLVGECYIQGLMNGEGLTMGSRQKCALV